MAQTLTQHVLESQKGHPEAKGELSGLLTQIGVAAKVLSYKVNRAGLQGILGAAGRVNVQGERVQKLDVVANETVIDMLQRSGFVAGMVSEEDEEWLEVPEHNRGYYVVIFDPLDGSSNIDVNVSVGTIFAIYKKVSNDPGLTKKDVLRQGKDIVAAGYVIYGSSTMFVYSTGNGVHGFTLDPGVGEFLLSHPDMRIPDQCKVLSINECNQPYWHRWTHELVRILKKRNDDDKRRISARFIGSAVADVHRNLLMGGVFIYPGDTRNPKGRLRLMYECIPLGYIIEQAGGRASNGLEPILEVTPRSLHQRSSFICGNRAEVELAEQLVARFGEDDTGEQAAKRP